MTIREFIRIKEIRYLFFRADRVLMGFSNGQGSAYSLLINDGINTLRKNEEIKFT
jgi:hypothetical protein